MVGESFADPFPKVTISTQYQDLKENITPDFSKHRRIVNACFFLI
jgi:hypothetical protein